MFQSLSFLLSEWKHLDEPVHVAPGQGRRQGRPPQERLPPEALGGAPPQRVAAPQMRGARRIPADPPRGREQGALAGQPPHLSDEARSRGSALLRRRLFQ